jgi:glutamate racemase
MDNRPIGIFDSGVGGLTVAKEIYRALPNESTIYLGDTARIPYGPRSPDIIIRFSHQIVSFLITQNVKAIIVACSTASALALASLKKSFSIPLYGMIETTTQSASLATKNGHIAVIGTKGTINSHAFKNCLTRLNPNHKILEQACPLLVPVIEEGIFDGPILTQILSKYLFPLQTFKPDTLILGCTHYPLIASAISQFFSNDPTLINPGEALASSLIESLPEKLRAKSCPKPIHQYYTTDKPEYFNRIAEQFLPHHHFPTKQISI